jgi:hypothetical protein
VSARQNSPDKASNRVSGPKELEAFNARFSGLLFDVLPLPFSQLLYQVFEHLLANGEELARTSPPTASRQLLEALHTLQIVKRFQPILFRFVYDQIEAKIRRDASGQWSTPELDPTLEWLDLAVLPWLALILDPSSGTRRVAFVEPFEPLQDSKVTDPHKDRFEYHIHTTLCTLRCVDTAR